MNDTTSNSTAIISDGQGHTLQIPLSYENGRWVGQVIIDGVSYHFEKANANLLMSIYTVDTDHDYLPAADAYGDCCIIAPVSL